MTQDYTDYSGFLFSCYYHSVSIYILPVNCKCVDIHAWLQFADVRRYATKKTAHRFR